MGDLPAGDAPHRRDRADGRDAAHLGPFPAHHGLPGTGRGRADASVKGLDAQVDEVARTLNVFLGYATFRDELGGTPAARHPVRGPAGDRQDVPGEGDGQAGGRAVPVRLGAGVPVDVATGMTAYRRSGRSSRRCARRRASEGGAIGFIEEIDAIGSARRASASPGAARALARPVSHFMSARRPAAMVNELLIQMQSFDQPPLRDPVRARVDRVAQRLPARRTVSSRPASPSTTTSC